MIYQWWEDEYRGRIADYLRVNDLAGIVDRAYQRGLRIVLWLSAVLVVVSLAFVKRGEASPAKGHDGGSPHR